MASTADRVTAPLGRRAARVLSNTDAGNYRYVTVVDETGPLPDAGQFYMLGVPGWGGEDGRPYLNRAMSVASAEPSPGASGSSEGARLGFLVDSVGPGTTAVAAAGEELMLVGPLGRPFSTPRSINPDANGAILVGGGVGVAPLAIWRRELVRLGIPNRTILGFRDEAHSGGIDLFDCSEIRLAFEDGSRGHHGRVTDLLEVLLAGDDTGGAVVYSCGPPAMLEAVRKMCEAAGVPCELALETPMACGFGACFGCAVPAADGGYLRLCVDGPVVRGDEIATALVEGSGH